MVTIDVTALRARMPAAAAATLHTGAELLQAERERFRGPAPGASSGSSSRSSLGPSLETSLAPFDGLLGGGLRRGALTELDGAFSSGRLAMGLSVLAAATRGGESAALVDLEASLDPQMARAAGVVLERLLWASPKTVEDALIAAEIVVGVGLGVVVLDLGLADPRAVTARAHESRWTRLAQVAAAHGTALLVLSPARASGSAAHTVVRLARSRIEWLASGVPPRLLAGIVAELHLEKRRGSPPGEVASISLFLPETLVGNMPDDSSNRVPVGAGVPARGVAAR